jgi:hypothetical protein
MDGIWMMKFRVQGRAIAMLKAPNSRGKLYSGGNVEPTEGKNSKILLQANESGRTKNTPSEGHSLGESSGQIQLEPGRADCREHAPPARLRAIFYAGGAFLSGAMGAAIDNIVLLNPMSDDASAAMPTSRREFLDSTFEAVERVGIPA